MRISSAQRLANNQHYLERSQSRMDRIQEQLGTGRKVQRASDDPPGASLALQHRRNIAYETQMRRNIDGGLAFMNATESALIGASETLQRARELAVQGANDTLGQAERDALAAELNQLIRHLGQVANTRFGDAYIFSGHATDAPAYTVTDGGGGPSAVTYDGDSGERLRRISASDESAINLTGDATFGAIFDDLITLRDDLASGAPGQTISGRLGSIDSGIDRILAARADLGARINRFQSARSQSEVTDIDLQGLRSEIEDVDLAAAVVELQGAEIALQAAMGAIGRTNNMTILNFLS